MASDILAIWSKLVNDFIATHPPFLWSCEDYPYWPVAEPLIYTRTSPRENIGFYSHAFQRSEGEAMARRFGREVAVFDRADERGVSGYTLSDTKRRGLNNLIARACNRHSRGPIIAWDLSRLIRNPSLLHTLSGSGIHFVTVQNVLAPPQALHGLRIRLANQVPQQAARKCFEFREDL